MRCLAQRMPDMAHRPRQLQLPSLQGQLMTLMFILTPRLPVFSKFSIGVLCYFTNQEESKHLEAAPPSPPGMALVGASQSSWDQGLLLPPPQSLATQVDPQRPAALRSLSRRAPGLSLCFLSQAAPWLPLVTWVCSVLCSRWTLLPLLAVARAMALLGRACQLLSTPPTL